MMKSLPNRRSFLRHGLRTARSFLGLWLLLILPVASLPKLARAEESRKPVEALRDTKLFAFGGIGAAGTTSQGEIDYRDVSAAPTAEADFTKLLKSGTPEAQCYALVGLRQKNRAAYETSVKPFAASKKEVQTCGGCILAKLPMNMVVANIERGYYDGKATANPPVGK